MSEIGVQLFKHIKNIKRTDEPKAVQIKFIRTTYFMAIA